VSLIEAAAAVLLLLGSLAVLLGVRLSEIACGDLADDQPARAPEEPPVRHAA
jgi:hypothetical protein